MKATGKELAAILGISEAYVSQLKREGTFTLGPGGRYDVPQNVQAFIARIEAGPFSEALAQCRTKVLEQQARRLKIQNDRLEGTLLHYGDAAGVLMKAITVVRGALRDLPARCARAVAGHTDPAATQALLDAECQRTLQVMYDAMAPLGEAVAARIDAQ